jgi:hypothetical protein
VVKGQELKQTSRLLAKNGEVPLKHRDIREETKGKNSTKMKERALGMKRVRNNGHVVMGFIITAVELSLIRQICPIIEDAIREFNKLCTLLRDFLSLRRQM